MAAERETVANSELLYKTQTRFGQSYKQHFFRFLKPLQSGGCYSLQYSNRNKLAEIRLQNVLSVDKRQAKSQDYAFAIHCLDSKYQFACTSLNDMERWVGTLRKELLAAPSLSKPGQDTIGVEIDPTSLSQHLQLGGLYLLEVTQSDIILWLPRSRKETIRWSLSCIHSLDHRRPLGAQLQMVVIELNELSATGQGTLIFKTENGVHIVHLVEKYTGKKVQGLEASLRNHKSVRKRTSSQEDVRSKRNDFFFHGESLDLSRSAATTDFDTNKRGSGKSALRRYTSDSSCPSDSSSAPAQRSPMSPPHTASRKLEPLTLHSGISQFSQSPSPQPSNLTPSPHTTRRQHDPLPMEGVQVLLTPPVLSLPRDITSECSMIPPLPPRPPGMPCTPVDEVEDSPSLGSNKSLRSISLDGMSLPSSHLSPGGMSPPLNRCASPLFHTTGQPSLPPRPLSPGVQRSPAFPVNSPPVIPPRPHNSLDSRGSRSSPFSSVPIRPLPGQSPPPVQPRHFDSMPLPGRAVGRPPASPMFPRVNYENTDLSR